MVRIPMQATVACKAPRRRAASMHPSLCSISPVHSSQLEAELLSGIVCVHATSLPHICSAFVVHCLSFLLLGCFPVSPKLFGIQSTPIALYLSGPPSLVASQCRSYQEGIPACFVHGCFTASGTKRAGDRHATGLGSSFQD